MIDIVGYIAGFCTTIAFFPQILKIIKTNDTKDVSLKMYIIFTFGVFMWFFYGVLLNNKVMIITNSISLIFAGYILYKKITEK